MTIVLGRILVLGLVTGLALLGGGPAGAATFNVLCSESDLRAKMLLDTNTSDILIIPDDCVIKISSNTGDNDNLNGDFDFNDTTNTTKTELTIQGSGPGRSIIDADFLDRVFDVNNKTINLIGLTVRNGDATVSANGSDNAAGGIRIAGTLTAENVVFENNKGNVGGGIFDNDAAINLTNVALIGNTATTGDGGGAFFSLTQDTLTNVTVSGNTAPATGTGEGNGAGIYHDIGPLSITNSTIANNTAGDTAGGLYVLGSTTIKNTLIGGNTATASDADCFVDGVSGGVLTSDGNNVVQNKSAGCTFTNATGDVVNTDPLIEEFATNHEGPRPTFTHGLLPGSPAIDAGGAGAGAGGIGTVPATDQRGVSRVGTADIGAFESTGPGVSARSNDVGYGQGDRLALGVLVSTDTAPLAGNVFAGLLFPAGFDPGCSGQLVVLLTPGGGFQIRCTGTDPLSSFAALAPNVAIGPGSTFNVDDLFVVDLLPFVPAGPAQFFMLIGSLEPLDIQAVSIVDFFFRTDP